jgi:NADH-quinone oxidoreductase subunit C
MNQESIRDRILQEFGSDLQCVEFRDQISVVVPKDQILSVCSFLKNDPELNFNYLSFVGGVDLLPNDPRFEIVYQLFSVNHNHRFRIKTRIEESDARIESVTSLWPTADWHERETSEMFGIEFLNHPDPRKLLLPEDWTIHPLRKDFPVEGTDDTPDLPRQGRKDLQA